MKKNGVISVIVPVYRVERYLEECIESILNQTYRELEILLIDDGSPDRCGGICDRYAQADGRITVVHQKNGGAAAARNAGLRMAGGEYITFVDGDDFVEPDAYEKMLRALEDSGADMVQSGFRYVYADGSEVHPGADGPCRFTAPQYLLRFMEDWTCALCWDKLFRRHVLEDVFFEEGHLIDDEFFTYRGVMNAQSILYIPAVTYDYRQRASGVMKNQTTVERKNFDTLEMLEKRRDQVISRFPELRTAFEGHYADQLLYLAGSDHATKNTVREIKKRLLAFAARGKVPFWKQGQRKRALRVLAFLMTPAGARQEKQTEGTNHSGHKFFE